MKKVLIVLKSVFVLIVVFAALTPTALAASRRTITPYIGGGGRNNLNNEFVTEYGGGVSYFHPDSWWTARGDLTYFRRDVSFDNNEIEFEVNYFLNPRKDNFYAYFGPFLGINEVINGETWEEPNFIAGILGGFTKTNSKDTFSFSFEGGYKWVSPTSYYVINTYASFKVSNKVNIFTMLTLDDRIDSPFVPSEHYTVRLVFGPEFYL